MTDHTFEASPLESLIASHRSQLGLLSNAWLSSGAYHVGLSDMHGRILMCWPAGSHFNGESNITSVELRCAGHNVGKWWVAGGPNGAYNASAVQARMDADAALISHLIQSELDLESMTSELIAAQDQLLAFYQLARSTRGVVNMEDTLNTLAREAAHLVKVKAACLLFFSGNRHQIVQYPSNLVDEAFVTVLYEQIQARHSEMLFNDAASLPETIENLVLVPITIRGEIAAALGLINKSSGHFSSPDLKLAHAIAEQIGAKIENILLYEESLDQARLKAELDVAANIQARLLPQHLPQVAGLDIWATSIQARQVGGDFYDFIPWGDGSVVFVVGDVAGKGMSSALLMAMMRTVMRSRAGSFAMLPGRLLSLTNSDLYDDYTEVSMFTTALVGHYDPTRQQLVYTNAGHSPVIYCPASGEARMLQATDMPVGILPHIVYSEETLQLRPGDILLVGTDGLSEARSGQGDLFGYERLLYLVQSSKDESAHTIGNIIFESVNNFSAGHPQDDDQTLMIIRCV